VRDVPKKRGRPPKIRESSDQEDSKKSSVRGKISYKEKYLGKTFLEIDYENEGNSIFT